MKYINIEDRQVKIISSSEITDAIKELFVSVNHHLTDDVVRTMALCSECESNPLAKAVLCKLCDNLDAAVELNVPVCQDTGMAVVFVELGNNVHITGDTLENAINEGVSAAYVDGKMRLSVVRDPLYDRVNTKDNTPAIIHIKSVSGDTIKLTAAPKGFGSENMSFLKMFTPSASEDDICDFVVDAVRRAGSNPCPPIVVGVGIGGNFEYSALLAKKALTRPLDDENRIGKYSALEKKLLQKINELGIGPQGFGGDTTALAVKIETAPTHIAGLPVAVNINCHVARHKSVTI